MIVGASIHNSPGVQDVFNTTPAWAFPYIGSNVAPGPSASAILDGAFAQKATGATAYAQLDGTWYAELGTYRMQTLTLQKDFGIAEGDRDPGALRSPLYARFVARKAFDSSSVNVGMVLFNTGYQADRTQPDVTHIRDIGVDASYRWAINDLTTATALASVIHESRSGASLTEYNVNASYYWDGSYGATLQRFGVNAPGLGSLGSRLQLDWTPLGKTVQTGLFQPNLRLGLQYTAYDRLDGETGSAASDANNVFLFAWIAF
jgi:hypothetical protein